MLILRKYANFYFIILVLCILSCQGNEQNNTAEYNSSISVEQSQLDGFFIAYYAPDKTEIKLRDGRVINIPEAWVEKQHYSKNGETVIGDGIYVTVPIFAPLFIDLTTSQVNEKPFCGENNNWMKTGFVTQVNQQTDEVMFYVKEGKYFDSITNVITFSRKK